MSTTKPTSGPDEAPAEAKPVFQKDLEKERDTRPERLARLSGEVDTLFPGEGLAELRTDIKGRSLNVPQFDPHHNEGMFMDTHLERILANIQDIKAGRFPEAVPSDARSWMQEVVTGNERTLAMYTFLHDISKPDSLTVKYADGRSIEPSWDEWVAMLPEGVNGDPVKLDAFCREQGIIGISYFQKEKEKQHGHMGAERLAALREAIGIPQTVLTAINHHEVAYQFQSVAIKTYEKYFGGLSEEEIKWVVTASYIDTMGSLNEQGQPDLSNFRAMVDTAHNYRVIQQVKDALQPKGQILEGLDPKKVAKVIQSLINEKSRFSEDSDSMKEHLKKECRFSVYDPNKLEASLSALVLTGLIDDGTKVSILALIDPSTGRLDEAGFGPIRGKLGKANRLVTEALSAAEIK